MLAVIVARYMCSVRMMHFIGFLLSLKKRLIEQKKIIASSGVVVLQDEMFRGGHIELQYKSLVPDGRYDKVFGFVDIFSKEEERIRSGAERK
jgi:hypothetical protein